MDKLSLYREAIKKLLTEYTASEKYDDDYECQLIFDQKKDHYLWLELGWDECRRIYYTVIHFDVKNGKIWLQQNATDLNPAEDLIELGVNREDIVLGLQPPHKRPYTNYGVA